MKNMNSNQWNFSSGCTGFLTQWFPTGGGFRYYKRGM